MTDYAELKRLAAACGDLNWRTIQESWCEWAIRDDHAYIATMRTKSAKHAGPCPDREAKAKFLCAVTPAVVRALIDENERQAAQFKEWQASHHANYCSVADERDQLRAEVAGLKTGFQAYEQVNAELKAENESLRKRIESLSQLKDGPLSWRYAKCLACGGYHHRQSGLPCPVMRVTAQAELPETRSGQIGDAMGKGEQP